ncbi:GDSL-type esterase/lipase family protein [Rhizobium sp. DKSPLA3]|uniref:GDSL-type esterase/lipase family protein n=1 Tax=Rhizobium quercicola TaxID=2901226 RepID=A0A9X1T010_9HYPH|nr:GDSL-type esterase/lipase family protein [Rhizobium quercicola]MCD7109031.1 GDSL-type esterase/lipase family protein [Rhizobium quercicola]
MKSRSWVLALLVVVITFATGSFKSEHSECGASETASVPRDNPEWSRKAVALEHLTAGAKYVMIGDSLTERLPREIAAEIFNGKQPFNAGIGGDTLANLNWRISRLDIRRARIITFLGGANDIAQHAASPEYAARGIGSAVHKLREYAPEAEIFLIAVLPTGLEAGSITEKIQQTNDSLRRCQWDSHVHFLDLGDYLTAGPSPVPQILMPDKIHLSREGYLRILPALKRALSSYL